MADKGVSKLPVLPELLGRKIYKTGQTRGADDDVIYQNRVGRNSTVLIPFDTFEKTRCPPPKGETSFENGFIVLINPEKFFAINKLPTLKNLGLSLGDNLLVFYETRKQWANFNPTTMNWKPATQRKPPLGGEFVARVPATTAAKDGGKVNLGFTSTSNKGAGIRVYEYASSKTINQCRLQLEALVWLCTDSINVLKNYGMSEKDAKRRKSEILDRCLKINLLDYKKLIDVRVINKEKHTICPLCLEELSCGGFFTKMQQATGREVMDLTVTEISLFHIEELRVGIYNHLPYNVGWGHHHCNVVVKDSGIKNTLKWLEIVVNKNKAAGFL